MKIIDDETGAPTKVDAKDVIVEKRKSMRTDQTNEEIFGTSEYMIEPEAYKLKSIPEIELTYQLMPFLSTEDKQYSEPFDELRRSTEEEKKGIRAMMLEILNKAGPSFARAARSLNVVLPGATVSTKTRGRITMDPNNSIKSFDKAYKMWEDAVPETQGNIDSKYAWRGIFELALFLTYPSPVMVSDINNIRSNADHRRGTEGHSGNARHVARRHIHCHRQQEAHRRRREGHCQQAARQRDGQRQAIQAHGEGRREGQGCR